MKADSVDRSARAKRDSVIIRASFALLVVAVATANTLLYAIRAVLDGGDSYQAGRWLINYSGGFVRRGLLGEVFRSIGPHGDVALFLLLGFQILTYAVLFAYFGWYLLRERFSWASIALTCSPAALSFVGWDPAAGFYNEILVFAVLVLLATARTSAQETRFLALAALAAVIYAVTVLSWEGSSFALPMALFLLLGGAPAPGRAAKARVLAAVFSIIAIVGTVVAAMYPGTAATAAAICESVRADGLYGQQLCSGAIADIGLTLKHNVKALLTALPLYIGYAPLIGLSMLPIVASRWFSRNWRWALASLLGMLPLFSIAADWGRWTYILAVGLAICIIASKPGDDFSRVWTPLSTVLFISLWGIPAWLPSDGSWPPLGFLSTSTELAVRLLRHLASLF